MRKQPTARMRKVNETLREVIAEEVPKLKDPRIGFVTITEVDAAPDLRNAIVYFSAMGSDEERSETASGLQHAATHLQAVVASEVRLKYTPRLRFDFDHSIEEGLRITEILQELTDDE